MVVPIQVVARAREERPVMHCGTCGRVEPKFEGWPHCRTCSERTCPDCDWPWNRSEDEANLTTCKACATKEPVGNEVTT